MVRKADVFVGLSDGFSATLYSFAIFDDETTQQY